MMLLQNWSFSSVLLSYSGSHGLIKTTVNHGYKISSREVYHLFFRRNPKTTISYISSGTQVTELFQNKVLIAAAASAAMGQLSKPFTSILLRGNRRFDFKAAFQAGGFPSTHSSVAVATATTLGLERGFSDLIFGLAVVYACLVMYDAQGVRREVGNHAKALNRAFSRDKLNQISSVTDASDFAGSFSGESSNSESHEPSFWEKLKPSQLQAPNTLLLLKSDDRTESTASKTTSGVVPSVERKSDSFGHTYLKESVGHTEIEVVAGALLGFFVSVIVYSMMDQELQF